jgi:hypothetical protein
MPNEHNVGTCQCLTSATPGGWANCQQTANCSHVLISQQQVVNLREKAANHTTGKIPSVALPNALPAASCLLADDMHISSAGTCQPQWGHCMYRHSGHTQVHLQLTRSGTLQQSQQTLGIKPEGTDVQTPGSTTPPAWRAADTRNLPTPLYAMSTFKKGILTTQRVVKPSTLSTAYKAITEHLQGWRSRCFFIQCLSIPPPCGKWHHKILMVQHNHHRQVLIHTHKSDPSSKAKNKMGKKNTVRRDDSNKPHLEQTLKKTQQWPANTCPTLC